MIELLSKSDSRQALEAEMELWMASGAQLAWMIDPIAREVLVYRSGGEVVALQGPEVMIADEVVPGFRLEMRKFWSE